MSHNKGWAGKPFTHFLRDHARHENSIAIVKSARETATLSYKELYAKASMALGYLQRSGLSAGSELIIQTEDIADFLTLFWACLMGKIIPVPLATGNSPDQKAKVFKVWEKLNAPFLIGHPENTERLRLFAEASGFIFPDEQRLLLTSEANASQVAGSEVEIGQDDIAYIQFSSGSTGDPKGVVLTHANLLANTAAIAERSAITAADVMLSWMPLTHDMGLICFHLTGMLTGIPQVIIPTSLFIRNPVLWMAKAAEHRASLLYSPNFGYQYFLSALEHLPPANWDLSAVRLIYNGAEPISSELCGNFTATLAHLGLREDVMFPGYGLAEASVAVSLPYPGEKIVETKLHRKQLNRGQQVVEDAGSNGVPFVGVGQPVSHCGVRIADEKNKPLSDGVIGEIQIKGTNVTKRYYNDPAASRRLFTSDGWLHTGDLGFLQEGRLFVTGRIKNIIIINGQNYYAHDIERIAQQTGMADAGKVAACGVLVEGKEALVIFVLHKGSIEDFKPVAAVVSNCVSAETGLTPAHVIAVRKIPKTTSGKVQHFKMAEAFQKGEFNNQLTAGSTTLQDICQKIFDQNPKEDLFENGLDSLRAMQLVMMINAAFHTSITVNDILNHRDITSLEVFVNGQRRDLQLPEIKKILPAASYPVSDIQKRFYILEQFDRQLAPGNISIAYSIHGALDREKLFRSYALVIERHESLRTTFHVADGTIVQQIHPYTEDLFHPVFIEGAAPGIIQQKSIEKFNLGEDLPIRLTLLRTGHNRHIMLLSLHHIVSDGWSIAVLMQEAAAYYKRLTAGEAPEIAPLNFHYKDFIAATKADYSGQRTYWLKELDGFTRLRLPSKPQKPGKQDVTATEMVFDLDTSLLEKLKQQSIRGNCTLFTTLVTVLTLLLEKYTGQQDILIGSNDAGRKHHLLSDQVGNYLCTFLLRLQTAGHMSFTSLQEHVKEKLQAATSNLDYSFDLLAEELTGSLGRNINSFFDVLVLMRRFDEIFEVDDMGDGLEMEEYPLKPSSGLSDLQFEFIFRKGKMALHITYNAGKYDTILIKNLGLHFIRLADFITHAPDEMPDLLSEGDKQLLFSYNTDKKQGKAPDLITAMKMVPKDHIALVDGDRHFSYGHMLDLAAGIAGELQAMGGTRIGLTAPRSAELVMSVIGIMGAGATYIYLDPDYPEERVKYMIADSAPDHIITNSTFSPADADRLQTADQAETAYIVYTSGTTGTPKGVAVAYAAVQDYVHSFHQYFEITNNDRVVQQSSLSFDTSVEEIFPILCAGGTLLVSRTGGRDTHELARLLVKEKATILSTTPLVLSELNKDPANAEGIRLLISGGDVLHPGHIDRLLKKTVVYNTYGPSESTVCATFGRINTVDDCRRIGKPFANRQVFIMDDDCNLLPPGATGEICLGGAGVAQGYINRPEETRQAFVRYGKERIYRTGDIGTWDADGSLIFAGRKDHQVKIRGYRVEPAEVEKVLLSHPAVQDCAVVVKKKNTENYLAAWYVGGEQPLRDYLRARLPDHMIPAVLIRLEKLPITVNGKVDRSALQALDTSSRASRERRDPKYAWEESLLHIYQKCLAQDTLRLEDDFFECGGNSITATRIVAQIREQLQLEVELKHIFTFPVIADMAALLSGLKQLAVNKIIPVEQALLYPASNSQKRIWFFEQFEDGKAMYNLGWSLEFEGEPDVAILNTAFNMLIARHEILRTAFLWQDGELQQQVTETNQAPFCLHSNLSKEDILRAFDLEQAPLIRGSLNRLDDTAFQLLICIHHIISDGWSLNILTEELVSIYNALKKKETPFLPSLNIQYKDYAAWCNQQNYNSSREYWMDRFDGDIPLINLPADASRNSVRSNKGETIYFNLDPALKRSLEDKAADAKSSLFMTLMSAMYVLLYRYTGQDDLVVGVPVSGRHHATLERQIGLYLNTLPIRCKVNAHASFMDLLMQVKEAMLEAYRNQDYPFDKLVESLSLQREANRSPLFDVMVGYQDISAAASSLSVMEGLTVLDHKMISAFSQFDLSVDFYAVHDDLKVRLEYNSGIFSKERMERMAGHFLEILHIISQNEDMLVSDIQYLPAVERTQLLETFNPVPVLSARGENIVSMFERNEALYPDMIAIISEDRFISYATLNEKANTLAWAIKSEYDDTAGLVVGIVLNRSEWLIVSMLGILKAGAAFIPVDPDYPEDRIAYILKDSQVGLVIADDRTSASLEAMGLRVMHVQLLQQAAFQQGNPPAWESSNRLAYVIYTSASTGLPKGVMVEHENLYSVAMSWLEDYRLLSFDVRLLQIASVAFDVFTGDVCRGLLSGGTLIICPAEVRTDPEAVLQWMADHQVNVLEATPSLLVPALRLAVARRQLMPHMELIILGSDVCSAEDFRFVQYHFGEYARVINSYGTTEATIDSSFYESTTVLPYGDVPIGKPLSNTRLYVLDEGGGLCPIGVPGELYIGGAGVGRGYLNREELTARHFLPDPFVPGGRLYRTGDLARWLDDGNLEFLGRNDHQLKVRGYRIEAGEVEQAIRETAAIEHVLVTAWNDLQGETYLVAYYVSTAGVKDSTLRRELAKRLPDYMVPSFFIAIEAFPLNTNGKVDRRSLPVPGTKPEEEYVAPANQLESLLTGIWSDVLQRPRISVSDNFFAIGGHSLKAARIISRLQKDHLLSATLRDIFTHPTIRTMAGVLRKGSYAPITPQPEAAHYPLSHAQQRLWIMDHYREGGLAYHMPAAYRLEGTLDVTRIQQAFIALMQRHEVLRTRIIELDGAPRQQVMPWDAEQHVLSISKTDEGSLSSDIASLLSKPFDLAAAPLIRAHLLAVSPAVHVLVCNIHHIISDGWSTEVLIHDLISLYNGELLPALPIQYSDYTVWQQNRLLGQARDYWHARFSGDIPRLELPTDFVRPPEKTFAGDIARLALPDASWQMVRKTAQKGQFSTFMVLLGALKVLLYRYTGQTDIVIGTAVAGRGQEELEWQIGFYVNTLPIRCQIAADEGFGATMETISQTLLDAYAHQDFPFDLLTAELPLPRDVSRSLLFDVMAVHQQTILAGRNFDDMQGLSVNPVTINQNSSKFDLTFNFIETDSGLLIEAEYNTDLFKPARIERMLRHYQVLLDALITDPEKPLRDINYLPDDELRMLTGLFNPTEVPYPSTDTIHGLFEQQVQASPESPALVYENQVWNYHALNARANQLAHYLRQQHAVKPNELVGLSLDEPAAAVISILGILKAGAAYVPIDTALPESRKKYIEEDAAIRIVVNDAIFADSSAADTSNPTQVNSSRDLIYVIYTSGSTGVPKGVMITHQAVANLISGLLLDMNATPSWKYLLTASLSFDASVKQIFMPLLSGAVLYTVKYTWDIASLLEVISNRQISTVHFSPSIWRHILQEAKDTAVFDSVVLATSGGESLPQSLAEKLLDIFGQGNVANMYGPTETCVNATWQRLYTDDTGIGNALPNYGIAILDENLQPVPVGITGEICIAGPCLAVGYLNSKSRTNESFQEYNKKRIYRTGDLGRFNESGTIRYEERKDTQIKLRGYRIEPEEIAAVLRQLEGVTDAHVMLREDRLIAYPSGTMTYTYNHYRQALKEKLPDYMIPDQFIPVARIPVKSNGKIDVDALPVKEDRERAGNDQPVGENELYLAAIWKELLQLDSVGVEDNFFNIGGHSLKALQVLSRIKKKFNRQLTLKDFFKGPTIRQLSVLLKTADITPYEQIIKVTDAQDYEISHAQKRLWMLNQMDDAQFSYNMSGGYLLLGALNLPALERAISEVIARHEILRTNFRQVEGIPRQVVRPAKPAEVIYEELEEQQIQKAVLETTTHPFSLETDDLLRVRVWKVGENRHILLIVMHHIVSDGWSGEIMAREIVQLYEGKKLLPLKVQYRDFAFSHNRWMKDAGMTAHRNYWLNCFAGELPLLNLPCDRPPVKASRGKSMRFTLGHDQCAGLRNMAAQQQVSVFMLLLTVTNTLLYRYSGQEDLIIGMPVAGRDHLDLEDQIGFYAETLALRTRFNGGGNMLELLEAVSVTVLEAYEHGMYPFDDLIKELNPARVPGRSPLFDVMIVYQEQKATHWISNGLEIRELQLESYATPYDLLFSITENSGVLTLDILYDHDLFEEAFISAMGQNFVQFASQITANPYMPINALEMVCSYVPQARIAVKDGNNKALPVGVVGTVQPFGVQGRWIQNGLLQIMDATSPFVYLNDEIIPVKILEEAIISTGIVRECKVLVQEDGATGNWLTAFVAHTGYLAVDKIKDAITTSIPAAMMAHTSIRKLISMPLTPSGQTDVRALRQLSFVKDQDLASFTVAADIQPLSIIIKEKPLQTGYRHLWDLLHVNAFTAATTAAAKKERINIAGDEKPSYINGGSVDLKPDHIRTVIDAFLHTVKHHPEQGIIIGLESGDYFHSYPALLHEARCIAAGLHAKRLYPGSRVILQITDQRKYFSAFWGCILGGVIPATVAIAPDYSTNNNVTSKLAGIWDLLEKPVILCDSELESSMHTFGAVFGLKGLSAQVVEELLQFPPLDEIPLRNENDIIFHQLSSGSTGVPKCVQITHRGILNSAFGSLQYIGFKAGETSLNWMPLDHVGAKIMYHLREVCTGMSQVQLKIELVLSNPARWLDYIHRYKVAHSWSPNFGYKLLADELDKEQSSNWDLSSLKTLLNAGEQVTLTVMKKFLKNTAPYGLREEMLQPAYGMAETCTGIAFKNDFTFSGIFHVKQSSLSGKIDFCDESDAEACSFISVGGARNGVEFRITDGENVVLPEGFIGRVQVRTPSCTPGYLNNPKADKEALLEGGWYNTGDLGFIWDEEVAITGREKEMIIIRGAHYYYYEIEDLVNQLQGVVPTFTGSCAVKDPVTGNEELAIFFSAADADFEAQAALIKRIRASVTQKFGINPLYIIVIDKEVFPKTTSGKIQRTALKESFQKGLFDAFIKKVDIALENETNILPDWFFEKTWVKKQIPEEMRKKRDGNILFFCADDKIVYATRETMPHRKVIQVRPGGPFRRISEDLFEIEIATNEDYEWLMDMAAPEDIIHAWNFAGTADIFSVIRLVKAVAKYRMDQHIRLWAVTSDAQLLPGEISADAEKGALIGLLRSAALEQPALQISHIDLPVWQAFQLADVLRTELASREHDSEVAYRQQDRFITKLKKNKPEDAGTYDPVALQEGGLYLITGGLGAIGYKLAETLVTRYRMKLILTGRTNEDKQGKLEALKIYSSHIAYFAIDVCDLAAMRQMLQSQEEKWQTKLCGIIHAAGTGNISDYLRNGEAQFIRNAPADLFREMMHSKLYGVRALNELVKDQPEVFIIACSSTNSYFGAVAYGAYAAASSGMDLFLLQLHAAGIRKTQTLNWSAWDDMGMNADNAFKHLAEAKGFHSIPCAQGIHSFFAALQMGRPGLFIGLNEGNILIRKHLFDHKKFPEEIFVFHTSDAVEDTTLQKHAVATIGQSVHIRRLPELLAPEELYSMQEGSLSPREQRVWTEQESEMLKIWKDVLGRSVIYPSENFFELGGDSIKAMQVVSRIYKHFNVNMQLKTVFLHPVIPELTAYVMAQSSAAPDVIPQVKDEEDYPLSHAQMRLWIMDQLEEERVAYNIPGTFIVTGEMNVSAFFGALGIVLARHESLRTIFVVRDDEPRQKIQAPGQYPFKPEFTSLLNATDEEMRHLADEEARKPFDLLKGPLFRTKIAMVGKNRYLLMFCLHHIISDGWSMSILFDEILKVYFGEAAALPSLKVRYRDFSAWQHEKLDEHVAGKHRSYFMEKFKGNLPVLRLPIDFERPPVQTFRGDSIALTVDQAVLMKLRELAQQKDASLFMVLLSAANILLHRYSGQEDIILGSIVSGREHPDLEDQIGLFANTLVFRACVHARLTVDLLLDNIRQEVLASYEHQFYPYDLVLKDLQLRRDRSRNPLFDVAINLQNMAVKQTDFQGMNGLRFDGFSIPFHVSKFDLLINFREIPEGLWMDISYNMDLFKKDTVALFAQRLVTLLEQIAEHTGMMIGEIILSDETVMNNDEKSFNFDF